jgi:hypothetical protein
VADPHYHPNDRASVQVMPLAGSTPWRMDTIDAAYTVPESAGSERVYVPWHGPHGPFLLDLFRLAWSGR